LEGEIAGWTIPSDEVIEGFLLPQVRKSNACHLVRTSYWSSVEQSEDVVVVAKRSGGCRPVRAGGSGTSPWNRKILVDHQDFAGWKSHFSPVMIVV